MQELSVIPIAVSYEIDESFDSDRFLKMRCKVMHSLDNPNGSYFELENIEKAKDSIYNIPVLAHVKFDDEDRPDFGSHDIEIEKDKMSENEGEYRFIYKEQPIGVIPFECNYTVEKIDDRDYVFVDAYIWKGYSNYAEDIIERDKTKNLSMEIKVDKYSYDAKQKFYNITDYRYAGITLLGDDIGTGMIGAKATTDFSEDSKTQMIVMMDELKEVLSSYNKQFSEEGGQVLENENLETVVEGTETQTFEEVVGTDNGEEVVETIVEENGTEEVAEVAETTEMSIENPKFVKSFELSHDDIRSALYALLAPVEDEDQEWYWISEVFDTHFYYENWNDKYFKQSYVKDGDLISFEGDRVEMFKEMLTKEEKDALENMRANYAELKSFKETKMAEEYDCQIKDIFDRFEKLIGDTEDFKTLKDSHDGMTPDEVAEKCYTINGKKTANFTIEKPKASGIKIPMEMSETEEIKPYGGLVEKYKK